MTAEELLARGKDFRFELVRGEPVPSPVRGWVHSRTLTNLFHLLYSFVDECRLGFVGIQVGCVLARSPDTVLGADVCFITRGREVGPGYLEGPPDLAIEVLSPDDRASETQKKIREYLAAGTRQVWVVDPDTRTIAVYYPSGEARIYSGQQDVTGGDILPGFSFQPERLFNLE